MHPCTKPDYLPSIDHLEVALMLGKYGRVGGTGGKVLLILPTLHLYLRQLVAILTPWGWGEELR